MDKFSLSGEKHIELFNEKEHLTLDGLAKIIKLQENLRD